jgi:hypothetical protein
MRPAPIVKAIKPAPPAPRAAAPREPDDRSWLDRSVLAKAVVGEIAQRAAQGPGVAKGLWDTAKDLPADAIFLSHFINPVNPRLIPFEKSARMELATGLANTISKGLDLASDPQAILERGKQRLKDWRATVDPTATPQAPTLWGEAGRRWDIGVNQGKLTFDVGSLL